MSQKSDPKWEIVDRLPGENKKPRKKRAPFYKRTSFWFGIGIGVALVAVFPPFRLLLTKIYSLWWLGVILAVYFVWNRKKGRLGNRKS